MASGTSGVGREKGGGLKPGDVIGTTDMISARANFEENSVNSVLNVGRDMVDEYGEEIVAFEVADLKPNAQGVLGYYDGSNIAINSSFMDTARINDAYDISHHVIICGMHIRHAVIKRLWRQLLLTNMVMPLLTRPHVRWAHLT